MATPKKYVDYVIDENGNVELEAHGFTDGACRQATKEFEDALGTVKDRKVKDHAPTVKAPVVKAGK